MYAIPPAPNVVRRLGCSQTACDPHPRQHKLSMYNNNSSWSNVGIPCLGQAVVLALACIAACQTPFTRRARLPKGITTFRRPRPVLLCGRRTTVRPTGLQASRRCRLKIGCNRYAAFASHLGVATNPDAVVLVGIVKPTSMPLSLTPFTKVTPTPLGSSTEV
jgi:hypothetical protein